MREIIYRAWEYKIKAWHYFHIPQDIGNKVMGMSNKLNYEHWCENTSFKDKNGMEIYEGDILESIVHGDFINIKNKKITEYQHYPTCEVFWNKFSTGFVPLDDEDFCLDCCEIIGNIYENKDLISG